MPLVACTSKWHKTSNGVYIWPYEGEKDTIYATCLCLNKVNTAKFRFLSILSERPYTKDELTEIIGARRMPVMEKDLERLIKIGLIQTGEEMSLSEDGKDFVDYITQLHKDQDYEEIKAKVIALKRSV